MSATPSLTSGPSTDHRVLSPLVEPLADNQRLVEMVMAVTGEVQDVVLRRMIDEETRLGTNVGREIKSRGIEPHVWSDELVAFYRETNAFLYESISWARYPLKLKMRSRIAAILDRCFQSPAKILAFGDGPGFDSLHLAQQGHDVTYFEVSGRGSKFAEALFASSQATVCLTTETGTFADASFDVIVCLDVLEHVPDPPGLVAQFARWLRPGGLLIVSAPFYLVSPDYSTHLESNRRFSGELGLLFRPCGFRLFGGDPLWLPMVLQNGTAVAGMPLNSRHDRAFAWLGGIMLRLGRYTSLPYVWGAMLLSRPSYSWKEDLERLADLQPECPPEMKSPSRWRIDSSSIPGERDRSAARQDVEGAEEIPVKRRSRNT